MKGFTKYKQSLDTILENSYDNKDGFKKNLSVIMGAIKFSKPLREFFTLYNEIELKKFKTKEDSSIYLTEAINLLKENKSELLKVKPLLDKLIDGRKELINKNVKTNNDLYESIDSMVFGSNAKNIENLIVSRKHLTESMVGVEVKKLIKPINPKILSFVMSKKHNEVYDTSLTESQKDILKNTLLMTEESIEKEFNNVKDIALSKVNLLLSESNDETLSARLVETKNEIKGLQSTKNSYIKVRGLLEDLN